MDGHVIHFLWLLFMIKIKVLGTYGLGTYINLQLHQSIGKMGKKREDLGRNFIINGNSKIRPWYWGLTMD